MDGSIWRDVNAKKVYWWILQNELGSFPFFLWSWSKYLWSWCWST